MTPVELALMIAGPSSLYKRRKKRGLTDRLGLTPDALPAGGNFYPEEDVLAMTVDRVADRARCHTVVLGAGLTVPVLARAVDGRGGVTAIESDGCRVRVTEAMLGEIGAEARCIEVGLHEYDRHNLWYDRHCLDLLPEEIDLLFLDGPGHFAGRTPRWPAGPELFTRLAPDAIVVLDDGRRVKEKKTLKRWAEDFPGLEQIKTDTSGGAVVLRPR
ncbi:MAG: hypothetical protein AAF439_09690 [Pseudomonadota bacterium]